MSAMNACEAVFCICAHLVQGLFRRQRRVCPKAPSRIQMHLAYAPAQATPSVHTLILKMEGGFEGPWPGHARGTGPRTGRTRFGAGVVGACMGLVHSCDSRCHSPSLVEALHTQYVQVQMQAQ